MNPYLIIGGLVGAVMLAVGGFAAGDHYRGLEDDKAIAKLKIDAATTLAVETAKSAAKDDAYAKLAREVDDEHAKHLQDLESTRADYDQRLSDRVRDTERRIRSSCPAAPKAVDPSGGANAAARSEPGLPQIDTGQLSRVAEAAMKLAEYAKSCNAWALGVGR